MDKLKEFFGKSGKAPDSGNSKEQRQREAELVEKMQNPPVASYTNPNAPMTYQELALLVPRDMCYRSIRNTGRYSGCSRI